MRHKGRLHQHTNTGRNSYDEMRLRRISIIAKQLADLTDRDCIENLSDIEIAKYAEILEGDPVNNEKY